MIWGIYREKTLFTTGRGSSLWNGLWHVKQKYFTAAFNRIPGFTCVDLWDSPAPGKTSLPHGKKIFLCSFFSLSHLNKNNWRPARSANIFSNIPEVYKEVHWVWVFWGGVFSRSNQSLGNFVFNALSPEAEGSAVHKAIYGTGIQ